MDAVNPLETESTNHTSFWATLLAVLLSFITFIVWYYEYHISRVKKNNNLASHDTSGTNFSAPSKTNTPEIHINNTNNHLAAPNIPQHDEQNPQAQPKAQEEKPIKKESPVIEEKRAQQVPPPAESQQKPRKNVAQKLEPGNPKTPSPKSPIKVDLSKREANQSPKARPVQLLPLLDIQHSEQYNKKINFFTKRSESAIMVQDDPTSTFELGAKMGEGSYGSVYRATNKQTGETVAIKIVELSDTEYDEIKQEINIMKQIRKHANIAHYYGSFLFDDSIWIVMEYCEGGSAFDLYAHFNAPFTEPEIAYICHCVLKALIYLHIQRKIHRDIKGANILITSTGDVKLIDFGVSACLSTTLSKRHSVVGTPYWMAPELISKGNYDEKVDIWSLGITAIELGDTDPPHANLQPLNVLFKIPSSSPPTLSQKEKWSDQINNFIACCVVVDPEQRQTAEQLLQHPFVKDAPLPPSLLNKVHGLLEDRAKHPVSFKRKLKRAPDAKRPDPVTPTRPLYQPEYSTFVVHGSPVSESKQNAQIQNVT